jgi:hypothetical protein
MAYTSEDIDQLFNALQFQPVGSLTDTRTHLTIQGEIRVVREGEDAPRYHAPAGEYTLIRGARDEYAILKAPENRERLFGLESHVWTINGDAIVARMAPDSREELRISGKVVQAPYQASKVA